MKKIFKRYSLEKIYAYVLTIGGSLGLIAMTWQASERVNMLKKNSLELSCNLNPVVDCGAVLNNKLAAILGFPNAFLGIIFFSILTTSGLVLLSGSKFKGWYRHFVMAVTLILMLFGVWFFGVSLYILGKICIFCAVGWIVSIPIFWYGLFYYMQNSSKKMNHYITDLFNFGLRHHLDFVIATYALMLALFIFRFRDYYF